MLTLSIRETFSCFLVALPRSISVVGVHISFSSMKWITFSSVNGLGLSILTREAELMPEDSPTEPQFTCTEKFCFERAEMEHVKISPLQSISIVTT